MTCNYPSRTFNLLLYTIVGLFILTVLFDQTGANDLQFKKADRILDQCEKCKILVNSFKAGLKKTQRGKHDGGDTHWEENKLNNYADSEIRLVEIQESLCDDAASGKDQCHSLAESYESELEVWFFNERKQERLEQKEEGSTLFEYFCNGIIKACCPDGHFGADCTPCVGYPDDVCQGRGYCIGNGTRTGNGKCKCINGYAGKSCEKCAKNYFQLGTHQKVDQNNQNIELPVECVRCDSSCSSSCHSIGPKGCHVCKQGYIWDNDNGCTDIDECLQEQSMNPCMNNTYCVNSIGSFQCYQCDNSCNGCTGTGPSACTECNENYIKVMGRCIEYEQNWLHAFWSPYLFYLCLSVVAFIIGRFNLVVASILGLFAGCYYAIYKLELTNDVNDIFQ